MIFWRILDNKVYSAYETDVLGFEKSEGMPDWLNKDGVTAKDIKYQGDPKRKL